jgi:hypothetical protein
MIGAGTWIGGTEVGVQSAGPEKSMEIERKIRRGSTRERGISVVRREEKVSD